MHVATITCTCSAVPVRCHGDVEMVMVVVPPAVSPVEPTIATVRVEHCNKFTNTQAHIHGNIIHKRMDFKLSFYETITTCVVFD